MQKIIDRLCELAEWADKEPNAPADLAETLAEAAAYISAAKDFSERIGQTLGMLGR